jgi:hypothetical protein
MIDYVPPMRTALTLAVLAMMIVTSQSLEAQGGAMVVREYYAAERSGTQITTWSVLPSKRGMAHPRITRGPRGMRFLGPFSADESIRMSLEGLAPHSIVRIELGWHIIGPWDGRTSNDRLRVTANGIDVVNALFSNTTSLQTWPDTTNTRTLPPRTRAKVSNLLGYPCSYTTGYTGPMDASYEHVAYLDHQSADLTVEIGALLSAPSLGECTKRWGLDHIEISVLDARPESALPHPLTPPPPLDAASYDGTEVREIAEFHQDGDFPGIRSTSELARELHISYLRSECNSCGERCLWYSYRLYTDGWLNVWSNGPARGRANFKTQLTPDELETMSSLMADCAALDLEPAYHDSTYEAQHLDLTHCALVMVVDEKEQRTEVWAGEPKQVRAVMDYVMELLRRREWTPLPKP